MAEKLPGESITKRIGEIEEKLSDPNCSKAPQLMIAFMNLYKEYLAPHCRRGDNEAINLMIRDRLYKLEIPGLSPLTEKELERIEKSFTHQGVKREQ